MDHRKELNLTVNFNGFNDFIALALGLKLGLQDAKLDALKALVPETRTKGDKQ